MSSANLSKLWTGKISLESFQSFILSHEEPIFLSQIKDSEFQKYSKPILETASLKPEQISMNLLFGIALFNRRFFWEAHETLEDIWMDSVGDLKTFYQGLIQISAAMYHVLNQNKVGYERLSRLGREKLATLKSPYLGVEFNEAIRALNNFDPLINDSAPFDFIHIPKLSFVGIQL